MRWDNPAGVGIIPGAPELINTHAELGKGTGSGAKRP